MNPFRGEVPLRLDGVDYGAKLTLGALVDLETRLALPNLVSLIERFETGQFQARDVQMVLLVALRAAGWQGEEIALERLEIAGGVAGAAQIAARLLLLAFAPPPAPAGA